ncbi:sce7726 family protein [Secundilactobacillus kimchicus]|uniref:sce7726 family protein n=1 Tax=Secundilactobacillus kimchicus TaxID=528209 RepID=UPI001DA3F77B|nr:sce7726 family protein [Secundilactobacillus kimchicus]
MRLLEDSIKQSLLDNQFLFNYIGDFGKSRVVFEKGLPPKNRLIADALIFTEKQGIIGVEMKTQYDTLARLERQLSYYKQICNYVFVYVHDSHLEGVIDLLKKRGYWGFVGIVSYTQFHDDVVVGLYKAAELNPHYNLVYSLKLLWRNEIRDILQAYTTKHGSLVARNHNLSYQPVFSHHMQMTTGYNGIASRKFTKRQLIANYVKLFGQKNGTQVLCQRFIYGDMNPEKYLKLYRFGDNLGQPEEIGIVT